MKHWIQNCHLLCQLFFTDYRQDEQNNGQTESLEVPSNNDYINFILERVDIRLATMLDLFEPHPGTETIQTSMRR